MVPPSDDSRMVDTVTPPQNSGDELATAPSERMEPQSCSDNDDRTRTHDRAGSSDETTRPPVSKPRDSSDGNDSSERARFRVLRPHAHGGLGQVFVARDEQLGREVALKEIQPPLADDPSSRSRFLLEAEVTGNLEHPGVVPVYALGRHADGRPYYAMRLIRGETLKDAIAGLHPLRTGGHQAPALEPRGLRSLVHRLVDVCQAMAYAHSRGVLHRDLKPTNILLGPYGETLVVDWGLAKVMKRGRAAAGHQPAEQPSPPRAAESFDPEVTQPTAEATTQVLRDGVPAVAAPMPCEPSLTTTEVIEHSSTQVADAMLELAAVKANQIDSNEQIVVTAQSGNLPWVPSSGSGEGHTLPGRAVGTPAYMSPEQAAGELERLSPATDVYSLGATLFCLLSGRPPFGESAEVATVLGQVQFGVFPPPRSIEPKVPKALEAICLKAMARRPEDRYASMTALANDLESWLGDEPVSAYREPWSSRITRWGRRHKAWAVSLGLTMLAVLAVLGFAAEGFRRSAARERAAREHGLRVAAKFAARTVAAEIDRRWRILEDEADDPALIDLMRKSDGQPFDSPTRQSLEHWLEKRFARHQPAAAAANWFLTDAHGSQIARAPLVEKGIGVNYAFRDYFHGQGGDLPEETPDIKPITRPHRSIVFRSRNTSTYMVVFSVPVFDLPDPTQPQSNQPVGQAGQVLGVLGMAVDVGRFGVLQLDVGGAQIAVLADLRPDETGRRGLVLHHPWYSGPMASARMAYLDGAHVHQLEALRQAALVRYRARSLLGPIAPLERNAPLAGSFENDYRDSLGGEYAGRWLAAFEPVLVEGRPDLIDDTGWIVIVQERSSGQGS